MSKEDKRGRHLAVVFPWCGQERGSIGGESIAFQKDAAQTLSVTPSGTTGRKPGRRKWLVCLLLIVGTLCVFGSLSGHDFITFDDDVYVTKNDHVKAGFTRESIRWALTTWYAEFWHPLTWLSHMMDCHLFGLNAGMHHLTNLLLHMVNSILVFLILNRMTGDLWRSAFVSALFAVHPLHVESVAWVAERKDVLSTLFGLMTLWAYARYAERPGGTRYGIVLLLFTLSLMAKPMVLTLPFVMLLLDFWPLGRVQTSAWRVDRSLAGPGLSFPRLVLEKVPLFVLAGAFVAVTFLAQQKGGHLQNLDLMPMKIRTANALLSYAGYIGKMVWPFHLAPYYPYPHPFPFWKAGVAGFFLAGFSVFLLTGWRTRPYLAVGWLWYLGTLVPVIGFVQIASFRMADRYTYLPLIGLFILIGWGVPDLVKQWRHQKVALALSGMVLLVLLGVCANRQVRHWRNTISLARHTLRVTGTNSTAHIMLAEALLEQGNPGEAIKHFAEVVRIEPDAWDIHYALGTLLSTQGKLDEAVRHFSASIQFNPDQADAHYNLGHTLARQGKLEAANHHYLEALYARPDFLEAHFNLGHNLSRQGRMAEAEEHFSEAIRIHPDYADAHYNLGYVLDRQGNTETAVRHYSEAVRIRPDDAKSRYMLGHTLGKLGKLEEALDHLSQAIRLEPDFADAAHGLAVAQYRLGMHEEAKESCRKVMDLGGKVHPYLLHALGLENMESNENMTIQFDAR